MFLLYAVLVGLVLGLVTGGRPANLGRLQFHWAWLAVLGLAGQLVLFSPAVTERVGDAGPWLYVLSSAAVLVSVLRNWRIPGLAIVAIGGALNLSAIAANGGFMPASPEALAAIGHHINPGYSNSAILNAPALELLTDRFAMPAGTPFANVFSIGDVVIGVGIALALAIGLHREVPSRTAIASGAPQGAGADEA